VRKILIIPILCFILSLTASAKPVLGEVYGVYPDGVMVDYGQGAYLVPVEQATFSVGGLQASWSKLLPGQYVEVQIPDLYWPKVVQVNDPYQWKMKNHPGHPHGGPPGQTKKNKGNSGNNGKGNKKNKGW
jgi:hypothetical protein